MDSFSTATAPAADAVRGRRVPLEGPTDNNDAADWEEWDGTSPFWVHCVAGSMAGVVEHTAVYPLDTVRTHIQVACSACAQQLHQQQGPGAAAKPRGPVSSLAGTAFPRTAAAAAASSVASSSSSNLPMGVLQTIRHLMNEPLVLAPNTATAAAALRAELPQAAHQVVGWTRLWRGVETMVLGCIPAHALYFSSYELVKAATSSDDGQVTAMGSSLAGAAAVVSHDLIMSPLDTVKQRMQLGHYESVRLAIQNMLRTEGTAVFYRSFPVTLASNVPYGMIMVTVNEHLKQTLDLGLGPWASIAVSSSIAGFVASAATTPLDRVKTSLQTQHLLPACYYKTNATSVTTSGGGTSAAAAAGATSMPPHCRLRTHHNWRDAVRFLWETEGFRGFWRGMVPRVLSHTPAVAISWTTYETAKHLLVGIGQQH